AWAKSAHGQVAQSPSDLNPHPTPGQVMGPEGMGILRGVAAIAGGTENSVALLREGAVWAWGTNRHGELGDGTDTLSRTTPVPVVGPGDRGVLSEVTAIAGSGCHRLALQRDGTVL